MSLESKLKSGRRKRQTILLIASILIITGLALGGLYIYWYFTGEKIIDMPLPEIGIVVNSEVDESPITEETVKSHTVPADHPRYLTIEAIGVKQARILSVGIDSKTGRIAAPIGIYDVGWFNQSAKPGQNGVVFLDGHNGGPTKTGVFKHLPDLKQGQTIKVERGDGTIFTYQVVENYLVPLAEFDEPKMARVLTPIDNQETLAIISCTGKWIQATKTYTQRVVIKATKIN